MKHFKKILATIGIIFCIVFANGIYYVFWGQDKSVAKLDSGEELNLYECCSIYSMHCAVWMFGWPISPEAAHEALLLHVPHKNNVTIESDFFLHSNKMSKDNKKLSWKLSSYNKIDNELRYSIALNSTNTKITRTKSSTTCSLFIAYSDYVSSVCSLPIRTKLFRYLQDINWLHPYHITYICRN